MIYLIGGSPRSGKTLLSKKLSKQLSIPYISTDIFRLFTLACLNAPEKHNYFPFDKMFEQAGNVESFFDKISGKDMLEADLQEAKNLAPGIKSFIEYNVQTNRDYIIEGVHLLPEFTQELAKQDNIKLVYLSKIDSSHIYQGLVDNKGQDDWISDNIESPEILKKAATSLSEYGKYFMNESNKHQLTCINTEKLFFDKIEEALKLLQTS